MSDSVKVIYKSGETNIQTTVYKDEEGVERCAYSAYLRKIEKDLTVREYLAENSRCACMSLNEALQRMDEAEEVAYIKPWAEITEDQWIDALEVLPPQKWLTVDEVELFRMSEYTTGDITAHYARYSGRYFVANRRVTTAYETLANEVKNLG